MENELPVWIPWVAGEFLWENLTSLCWFPSLLCTYKTLSIELTNEIPLGNEIVITSGDGEQQRRPAGRERYTVSVHPVTGQIIQTWHLSDSFGFQGTVRNVHSRDKTWFHVSSESLWNTFTLLGWMQMQSEATE